MAVELRQPTIQEVTQLVEGITKSITATVNDFDKPGIEINVNVSYPPFRLTITIRL